MKSSSCASNSEGVIFEDHLTFFTTGFTFAQALGMGQDPGGPEVNIAVLPVKLNIDDIKVIQNACI